MTRGNSQDDMIAMGRAGKTPLQFGGEIEGTMFQLAIGQRHCLAGRSRPVDRADGLTVVLQRALQVMDQPTAHGCALAWDSLGHWVKGRLRSEGLSVG